MCFLLVTGQMGTSGKSWQCYRLPVHWCVCVCACAYVCACAKRVVHVSINSFFCQETVTINKCVCEATISFKVRLATLSVLNCIKSARGSAAKDTPYPPPFTVCTPPSATCRFETRLIGASRQLNSEGLRTLIATYRPQSRKKPVHTLSPKRDATPPN